ncbi:hypothetical protein P43SY_010147 [Pythium insidiosum]|uniref:cGMP-dependent protein kinase n=1 Tax=Pythium insidiosum TaxID=114742 RepID=A0AAD5M1F2_PYTIN|nr:hypothetical protein P43SY_010147 [Pythium insidiosum]
MGCAQSTAHLGAEPGAQVFDPADPPASSPPASRRASALSSRLASLRWSSWAGAGKKSRSAQRLASPQPPLTPSSASVTEGVLSEILRNRRRSIRNTAEQLDAVESEQISVLLESESSPEGNGISAPEQDCIVQALRENVLFSCMQPEQLFALARLMHIQLVAPGEKVVTQGEIGDKFYVVRSGKFDVVNAQGDVINRLSTGTTFGELGLLYSAKRTANVIADAKCHGSLYALRGKFFRYVAAQHSIGTFHSSLEALRKVKLLQALPDEQLTVVANAVQALQYRAGDVIVHKGEAGSVMYMIHTGTVVCTDIGNGSGGATAVELSDGDYFGERALLVSEPRAATVLAKTDVRLLALDQQTFQSLLGPLQDVLDYNRMWRALESVTVLKPVPFALKRHVLDAAQLVRYAADEVVMHEGDVGDAFFIIKDGEVSVRQSPPPPADSTRAASSTQLRLPSPVGLGSAQSSPPAEALPPPLASPASSAPAPAPAPTATMTPRRSLLKRSPSWLARALVGPPTPTGSTTPTSSKTLPITRSSPELRRSLTAGGPPPLEVARLGAGDCFGEIALFAPERRRTASIVALTNVECLVLGRELFDEILAFAKDELEGQAKHRQLANQDRYFAHALSLETLERQRVIGVGSYGVVYLAKHAPTGRFVAVKAMSKARLEHGKQVTHIRNEKRLLELVNSPFILKFYAALQDATHVYLVTELLPGGELFQRIVSPTGHAIKLPQSDARFYVACCAMALGYLHERNVVYRDLKPENLLLDAQGYAKLVDFGFAKKLRGKTYTLCGTPEYLAPEIILGIGHSVAVDSWGLGVLLYEMVMGASPFAAKDEDHLSICRNILQENIKFPALNEASAEGTEELANWKALVLALLHKHPEKRASLSAGSALDIRRHEWFKGFDWDALRHHTMAAPWVPEVTEGGVDAGNFQAVAETELTTPQVQEKATPTWSWDKF